MIEQWKRRWQEKCYICAVYGCYRASGYGWCKIRLHQPNEVRFWQNGLQYLCEVAEILLFEWYRDESIFYIIERCITGDLTQCWTYVFKSWFSRVGVYDLEPLRTSRDLARVAQCGVFRAQFTWCYLVWKADFYFALHPSGWYILRQLVVNSGKTSATVNIHAFHVDKKMICSDCLLWHTNRLVEIVFK